MKLKNIYICKNNKFYFDEKVWKLFLKIKPTILINIGWLKLKNKKQWKRYFINKSITIKISD
jgi:hypothetical protein